MPDGPTDLRAGFAPWPRTSPFGDAAGPLLFREDGGRRTFAARIEQRHANGRGQAHGGMLTTFADLALGYAAAFSTDPPTGLHTVSLSIDFMAPVAVGQLLTATPQVLRIGSRLAHATAVLLADGASVHAPARPWLWSVEASPQSPRPRLEAAADGRCPTLVAGSRSNRPHGELEGLTSSALELLRCIATDRGGT